jgi:23S rRNA (uracil1939-C5)-methyltransferase/tRNA (uracil-5-)-methyltransferase
MKNTTEKFLSGDVIPPCPHFGRCGGCQYQHIAYEKQLKIKEEHIRKLFNPLLDCPTIDHCIPSPRPYGYRTKLTPHYGRIRSGNEPIGFRDIEGNRVVDVDYCPIATAEINGNLRELREHIHSRQTKRGGTALLRQGGKEVTSDPRRLLCEEVGGRRFHFTAGEFFQNNASILDTFATHVSDALFGDGLDYMIDAYCGVGFFSIFSAQRFRKIIGVEISRPAISMAKLNAETNGIRNGEYFLGSAEEIFQGIDLDPAHTTVLLDPPRRGAGTKFLQQLSAFFPRRIVYVACGPEAQAQEIKCLLQHYRMEMIQPVDLFPQTKHIENIVTLLRRDI